jgi:hypothetical protein
MHNRLCQGVVRFDSPKTSAKLAATVDADEGATRPIELTSLLRQRRRFPAHARLECATRESQQSLLIVPANPLEAGCVSTPVVYHQIAAAM